jgi:hypothetical protein
VLLLGESAPVGLKGPILQGFPQRLKNVLRNPWPTRLPSNFRNRATKNVVFENLNISGHLISNADKARFYIGAHVEGLTFKTSGDTSPKN